MFPILLALALQGAAAQPPAGGTTTPPPAPDAAPNPMRAAGQAWGACVRGRVDAGVSSDRAPDALVTEAFAGCATEQEAVRAAIAAQRGEEVAAQQMERVLSGGRTAFLEYIATQRGAAAAPAAPAQ